MALTKKITVKSVIGDVKKMFKGVTEKTAIMRVVGIARSMQAGEGDYGPWVKFKGTFQGINLLTGEEMTAPYCLLPEVASCLVENQLGADDVTSVEFGFDLYIKPSDTPIGFEYLAEPLVEPTGADPLAHLSKSLPAPPKVNQKALPALGKKEDDKNKGFVLN